MRTRWIGIAGLLALLTALVLNSLGPRLLPNAFGGTAGASMMNSGMMNGGMMESMMSSSTSFDPKEPFDRQFLDQMIMHHQNAVMMTEHMIADSERPELRDLAQRIITTQQQEIDQMRQWRRDWYGAATAATPQEAMMTQMMGDGMMNRDQMRQMMGGNVDLDRMFLEMMIPHHQSAVEMAQQALEQTQRQEITTLAQNIITTQQAEIEEMRGYLSQWYGVTDN